MVSKIISERKKMKKYFSFITCNYCFFSINMIEKLIDFGDINFNCIHYMLMEFMTNIFVICLANNMSLHKIKNIIENGCAIIFDYIIISREECLNTSTYKIKFNDAIQFAYQKTLTLINTHVKGNGQPFYNLKPINANKNLIAFINGINLIKHIFCCLFKIQFFNNNTLFKYIDILHYKSEIYQLKHITDTYYDTICGKKIDKIHKRINDILFYNINIIEQFIILCIPEILNIIKSTTYNTHVYNIYFGYLNEYYLNLQNIMKTQIDINCFTTIILLLRTHNIYHPYILFIQKIHDILDKINYEQLFGIPIQQLDINKIISSECHKQILNLL